MSAFWNEKKVFVTGHTGFKGAWLSLWLHKMGATVTGYALTPPTDPSLFAATGLDRKMHSVLGDVRNGTYLSKVLAEASPEIVFHLAAQPLVRESYRDPVTTYETNVMGTVHLLEAVRSVASVKAVIIITTDKCYENPEDGHRFVENEPLGGHDPYSSSKACAEIAVSAFRRSFFATGNSFHGAAVATARAGNVIGGGDWGTDRIVPDCMKALMGNRLVSIRNPAAVRPWQHVLEPLHGYLLLARALFEKGKTLAGSYNFGPDEMDEIPVQRLVQDLCTLWGDSRAYTMSDSDGPHEARYLKLDSSRARLALGWHPVWNVSQTLAGIAKWYRSWQEGKNMFGVCIGTIDHYEHEFNNFKESSNG